MSFSGFALKGSRGPRGPVGAKGLPGPRVSINVEIFMTIHSCPWCIYGYKNKIVKSYIPSIHRALLESGMGRSWYVSSSLISGHLCTKSSVCSSDFRKQKLSNVLKTTATHICCSISVLVEDVDFDVKVNSAAWLLSQLLQQNCHNMLGLYVHYDDPSHTIYKFCNITLHAKIDFDLCCSWSMW